MIGTVLAGRYELTGLIADGPIFSLYSARDKLSGKEVSLRLLKSPFDKEAALISSVGEAVKKSAAVQSPNVERLYEFNVDDDGAFIIGDLTRAPSLGERIRKLAPFTSPVAVTATLGMCRGLDAFHKVGLVHGDLSGDNVAMMADGETRLQMGGIWQAYSASPTAGAVVLPSMATYLAPEVSAGGMPSRRSDIYSVGVLIYELLTGRRPYVGETALATAMKHASEPTPRVRDINGSMPAVLDEIVYKAMAKDPADRYQSAGELYSDLKQMQDALRFGKTLVWPLRAVEPVPKPTQPQATTKTAQPSPKSVPEPKKVKAESDVPLWMMSIMIGAVAAAVFLAGFYYVYINFDRQRMVIVPNLKGLSSSEARSSLQGLRLKYKAGPTVPSDRIEADHIIEADPSPGSRVPENTQVTVTISTGSREVTVPSLKGLTPDKARQALATVNLQLDDQMDHASDPSLPDGVILAQSPDSGAKADSSRKIHVTVNTPSAPSLSPPAPSGAPAANPNQPSMEAGTYVYTISFALDNVSEPVHVRMEVTDDDGARTFYEQDNNPGDNIDTKVKAKGSQATFRIYYDDRMVKEFTKQAKESGE